MTKYTVTHGEQPREVAVTREGGDFLVTIGDETSHYRLLWQTDHETALERDGRQIVFASRTTPTGVELMIDGELWEIEVEKGGARRSRRKEDDHSLSAPMPGSVLRILTTAGSRVNKGDALLVLEAMKMEHTIAAPYSGVIEKIGCSEGQMVQPGVDLISIAPLEGESA